MRLRLPVITNPRVTAAARAVWCSHFFLSSSLYFFFKSSNSYPPAAPFKPKNYYALVASQRNFYFGKFESSFLSNSWRKRSWKCNIANFFIFFLSFSAFGIPFIQNSLLGQWADSMDEGIWSWVLFLGSTRCKERTDLYKLTSDFNTCSMAMHTCTSAFLHTNTCKEIDNCNKNYFTQK